MTVHDDVTRAAVLAEAGSWLGTPYRHQASRKGVGCDCLGLVRGVWRALYGDEPEVPGPYAADWAEAGTGDPLLEAARRHLIEIGPQERAPGDLLAFRWRPHMPAKHLGIFAEDNRFIHAYQGTAVVVSALVPQWRNRIAGVFAFPVLSSAPSGRCPLTRSAIASRPLPKGRGRAAGALARSSPQRGEGGREAAG